MPSANGNGGQIGAIMLRDVVWLILQHLRVVGVLRSKENRMIEISLTMLRLSSEAQT